MLMDCILCKTRILFPIFTRLQEYKKTTSMGKVKAEIEHGSDSFTRLHKSNSETKTLMIKADITL